MPGYQSLGDPSLSSYSAFPGYRGFRDALDTYMSQAAGPEKNAAGDLVRAGVGDEVGGAFQDETGVEGGFDAGGRGNDKGLGMFSGLMAGMGKSNVIGTGTTDLSRANALSGMTKVYSDVANSIYGIRSAREAEAATKQASKLQDLSTALGLFSAGLNGGMNASKVAPKPPPVGNFAGGSAQNLPIDPGTGPIGGGTDGLLSGSLSETDLPAEAAVGSATGVPAGAAATGAAGAAAGGSAAAGGTAAASGGLFSSLMTGIGALFA